jgi:hypothetical protein
MANHPSQTGFLAPAEADAAKEFLLNLIGFYGCRSLDREQAD